ncbi:hypothetical protein ACFP9V_15350 [Deinococcus radiopugnans]|uniref:hypothetical protein n=1 Tax=Deinococcus radiopugnans TaxID=57497 RepID=UPI0036236015
MAHGSSRATRASPRTRLGVWAARAIGMPTRNEPPTVSTAKNSVLRSAVPKRGSPNICT